MNKNPKNRIYNCLSTSFSFLLPLLSEVQGSINVVAYKYMYMNNMALRTSKLGQAHTVVIGKSIYKLKP